MPKWRNRQTRTTQNRVPLWSVGSIPSFGTRNYSISPPVIQEGLRFHMLQFLGNRRGLPDRRCSSGLGANFGLQINPEYRYLVQILEDTKVIQTKDGYEVNLYHSQLCGCGPHTTSIVKVVVTKDGEIITSDRVPAFEDPKQDNLCID